MGRKRSTESMDSPSYDKRERFTMPRSSSRENFYQDRESSRSYERRSAPSSRSSSSSRDGSSVVQRPDDSLDSRKESSSEGTVCYLRIFELASKELLILLPSTEEYLLKGSCSLRVIVGEIEIYGHRKFTDFVEVFSPSSASLLTVRPGHPIRDVFKSSSDILAGFLDKETEQTKCDILRSLSKDHIIISLKKSTSRAIELVPSLDTFRNIFSVSPLFTCRHTGKATDLLFKYGVELCSMSSSVSRFLVVSDLMYQAAFSSRQLFEDSTPNDPRCIVVCGGANSGKSTLIRFITNSLLNRLEKVCLLDCDLGQTEMTPAGLLSLSVIDKPLIGPPFTHQNRETFKVFFGAPTPSDDPVRYMKCVTFLVEHYNSLPSRPPLIVNTMGWNKGLGLMFLVDTIKLVKPQLVIQLNNSLKRSTDLPPVTGEFVRTTDGVSDKSCLDDVLEAGRPENCENHTDDNSTEVSPDDLEATKFFYQDHELLSLDVVSHNINPNRKSDSFSAADHRTMTFLGYLSGLNFPPDRSPISMSYFPEISPYVVHWNTVAVHVCHQPVPRSEILYALNASVVSLCRVPDDLMEIVSGNLPRFLNSVPVCESLGLGFIRAIDTVNHLFYIVTPVPQANLRVVNCLLRGSLNLPNQCFLNQNVPNIPYVDTPRAAIGAEAIPQRSKGKARLRLHSVPVSTEKTESSTVS